ncbi:MAG: DUF935 domain-containing protein [Candidatus Binatus sp.]|uniref:DUF935 domain-containing protein n=1 Tax=Candidatus Binatus sp. TaxID=2811406 RepID=UPI002728CD4B|nr:DUF935 domain-containing protein [Candidatus Binatus sp.]MDO8432057.1 DUF935 domain-containing protein [Candidatus Binatus sp.]
MKLYDSYGREVDTGKLRAEQASATMTGVRNSFAAMHPSAGLTPDRLAQILREAEAGDPYRYLELAEEMEEKDLHYLAVLGTRKQAVAQLDVTVAAVSGSAEDRRAADLVRELLVDGPVPLESALLDILDAIGKGFSATEIIWDTSGREWAPLHLKWRDPRWFEFDWVSGEEVLVRTLGGEREAEAGASRPRHLAARGVLGASAEERRAQPFTAPLAPYKFIVHFSKAKAGLPIRGGIARAAGWAYLFKNYVLKDWVTFTEIFGQPLRIGKYHPGATEQDRNTLLRAVANIGTDAAAIIPESMQIEFTEARQSGSAELYQKFCEYLDAQVSKAVLGQTLTTEMTHAGGSRAAAEVHQAVRADILNGDARRICATLARDLVRPIVDLNLGPHRRYPKIKLGMAEHEDVKALVEIVAMLADRGLRISQKAMLEKLGIAEAGENEAVLGRAGA